MGHAVRVDSFGEPEFTNSFMWGYIDGFYTFPFGLWLDVQLCEYSICAVFPLVADVGIGIGISVDDVGIASIFADSGDGVLECLVNGSHEFLLCLAEG